MEQGNTVLVIEHNLDVLKMYDHILELGLEVVQMENWSAVVLEKLAEEKTDWKVFEKTQGEPPFYQIPTVSDPISFRKYL